MSWIIGILTFILVLDSLFLILLILVQLPKKEAGLGTAFGSSTTDALFGAGTGNVLTKLTKYSTIVFFVITLSLSVMNAHQSKAKRTGLEQIMKAAVEETDSAPTPAAAQGQPTQPPATNPVISLTTDITNQLSSATNAAATNVPAPEPAPDKPDDKTSGPPTDAPEKPAEPPAVPPGAPAP